VGAQYAHIWTTFALIDIAPASAQNGGSARGYQRNLRNVGDSADLRSDQHVATQPEFYSSQSCTKMPAMPLTVLG
jgi:hypothetical protein